MGVGLVPAIRIICSMTQGVDMERNLCRRRALNTRRMSSTATNTAARPEELGLEPADYALVYPVPTAGLAIPSACVPAACRRSGVRRRAGCRGMESLQAGQRHCQQRRCGQRYA